MTYLCIKPRCSANCSMCSEAVLVPDPIEVLQVTHDALLRRCGFCKAWASKPCGESCELDPDDPTWEEIKAPKE